MTDRMMLERLAPPESEQTLRLRATLETMERLLGCAVREGLVATSPIDSCLLLRCRGDVSLRLWPGRSYTLARFDLRTPSADEWPVTTDSGEPVRRLDALLEILHPGLEASTRGRLLEELENSCRTMEESLRAADQLGPGSPGQGSLADWEGRVWLGHPLHPGARLRSGMTREDHQAFGPEWQVALQLPLLELPSEDVTFVGDFPARLAQLFPECLSAEACLVPVHPWALRHDLQQRFEKPFRSGRWRVSDLPPLSARPTMSLRTVILQSPYGDAHLKLPLAVQTTGATRTVSPAAAHNGPALSRLMQQIWASPAIARHLEPLHLMAEPASFCLADDSAGQARFLAGILRQGPGASQDGRRWLTPAAALLEPRENPLFVRVAAHYGSAPLDLWRAYVQALLPPLTFLAGRLGLALEGHPQNVLVDFRGPGGNAPEIHFHYRDLGGIRVHPERLQEGLEKLDLSLEPPAFWPGSATCTSSLRDLASKLIYSVLQNHLGELIRATVRCTGESESPYWSFVRRVLEGCRERMGEDLAGRVFSSFWDLKAMWRMRLDAAVTEYTYAPVENPL